VTVVISIVIAGLLILAIVACLAVRAARAAQTPPPHQPVQPEGLAWLRDFSIEKYQPLLRLLDSSDVDWLATQPGYEPRLAKQLGKQRARIFRAYLSLIGADGKQLQAIAWNLTVEADRDVRGLAAFISRQAWTLDLFLFRARLRLALWRLGVGRVDARPLLDVLEVLARTTRLLVSPQPLVN
jgi:hypothetical protein